MNIVLIQVLLIAVVVAVAARLFRSGGARSQAVRRIGLLLFAAFAVFTILVPDVWNRIAHFVGVGRGTDMVLYALVVAFLSYVVTTYLRFRDFEVRYTRLARRLALDEAARDFPHGGATRSPEGPSGGGRDGGDVLDEPGGRD
jgi:hypothetical protein